MVQASQYELNFRDYWRILRKRKFLILASFVVVFVVTVHQNRKQTPYYEASATIKVEQRQTLAAAILESSIQWNVGDPMESLGQVIESHPIAEETAAYIGLIHEGMSAEAKEEAISEVHDAISTQRVGQTNLIRIQSTHTDPQLAMKIASGTADVFVQWDLREKNKQARKLREFVENQLTTVEKKLHDSEESVKSFKEVESSSETAVPLHNELLALKTQLAELLVKATEKHPEVVRLKRRISEIESELKGTHGGETEYGRLVREAKLNEQLYTLFKQKFEEARIAEAEKVSDVSVVDYAKLPTSPVGGKKQVTLVLGGAMGLLLGFVLAFFVENLDTSISTMEGVENLLSVPVLAIIPYTRTNSRKVEKKWSFRLPFFGTKEEEIDHEARLIAHNQPKSSISESYRTLRTNLKFSEGMTGKSLVVTSSGPQEGKTTVLINLGLTTAQMGTKTLVVDSDMRRPTVYKTFKIPREPGLSEVLTGSISWQQAIRGLPDMLIGGMSLEDASKTPGLDQFFILPAGRIPLNPSELLGSRTMDTLLSALKDNFDVILYDTPPILPVTDAALLAPKVDGIVIVYEIGRTARNALLRAKQQIESNGGKVLGVVLNHIKTQTEPDAGYSYYNYKYYGKGKGEEEGERVSKRQGK